MVMSDTSFFSYISIYKTCILCEKNAVWYYNDNENEIIIRIIKYVAFMLSFNWIKVLK